ALSSSYMPQIYGLMSRTNGAGALVGGLLVAVGVQRLPRKARLGALALAAAAFAWADWVSAEEWARSWDKQQQILWKVAERAKTIEGPASILLAGTQAHVGRAVLFDAHYDFDAALRVTTGRKDLKGNIVTSRLRFEPEEAREV